MQTITSTQNEKQMGQAHLAKAEAILKSGQRFKYAFLLKAKEDLVAAQQCFNEYELEYYVSKSDPSCADLDNDVGGDDPCGLPAVGLLPSGAV